MGTDLGNIVFIVWRECVEALLIVGILNAWIAQREPRERHRARLYLWFGVAAGLALAIALAVLLVAAGGVMSGSAQQAFQTLMELVAAALILQMVFWMRRHGRTLKNEIMSDLSTSAERNQWLGVFALALVAVAREGSETVVFLYSTLIAQEGALPRIIAAIAGIVAALATYGILQLSSRVLSWRLFFQVSGFMLLCLAGALVVTAVDNLQSLEWLPEISGRLWDTSRFLSDSGSVGGLVAALTGYRAKPDLAQVLALACYWFAIYYAFSRNQSPATTS